MPLCYFLQRGQPRRWSPTTPSSWGSVCGLTWSRLAAFHCSRSGLQRGISVSSSHIHQHISHVHYAVYQWLRLMDIERVHVCVLFCLLTCVYGRVCYILGLLIFLSLSFHICSDFCPQSFFFFSLTATFYKSSAFHFQRKWIWKHSCEIAFCRICIQG